MPIASGGYLLSTRDKSPNTQCLRNQLEFIRLSENCKWNIAWKILQSRNNTKNGKYCTQVIISSNYDQSAAHSAIRVITYARNGDKYRLFITIPRIRRWVLVKYREFRVRESVLKRKHLIADEHPSASESLRLLKIERLVDFFIWSHNTADLAAVVSFALLMDLNSIDSPFVKRLH